VADVIAGIGTKTGHFMIAKDFIPYLGTKSFAIMEKQF
jgi:hypothetical protein